MKTRIGILCIIVVTSVSFWGCISTPFEVAGDVIGASFDAAGAVAEVPFTVAEAVVNVPFEMVDASWEGNANHKRQYSEQEQWIFDGSQIQEISAETRNGSIIVNATDGNQIYVEAQTNIYSRHKDSADRYAESVRTDIDKTSNQLDIRAHSPRPPKHTYTAVHYTIYTPPNVSLSLRTTNGRITLEDIDGDVKAISTNGQILAHNTNGHIHARTTNGRITLHGLQGDFNAVTTNGQINVEAHYVGFESYAKTTNARITVNVKDGNAPIKLITTNGSVDLTLPESFSGNLYARTSNGSVSSELPVTVRETKRNQLQGEIGSGGDTEVYIRSTNGRIQISKQTPMYSTASK